jgi:membrane-associated protease RseP (regulator of RpoE activity)
MLQILVELTLLYLATYLSVTLHELFHFLVAKIFKIKVVGFIIGKGLNLFQYSLKNIDLSFNLIPVYGFVDYRINKEDFYKFKNKLIIMALAGVTANFIILVMSVILIIKKQYSRYIDVFIISLLVVNVAVIYQNIIKRKQGNDIDVLKKIKDNSILNELP